ncbi:MAG: acyclic terpene utilization AtuA family protein [Chloroflexota bacterium]
MAYRVGSAQGYYGDDVTRALPMILGEHVDIVCFEALAELTLAILQKDKLRDPSRGFTFDIGIIASKILPEAYKRGIPLITNGGGLNPQGAAQLAYETAQKMGLSGLKIAYVTGDDMSNRLEALLDDGELLENIDTGEPLDPTSHHLVNANVYMGAQSIVEALKAGADMVITGRVADPCLHLAALVAHYDWAWDDWDKLASGIVAGHLLECTAQVVGGNSLAVIDDIDAKDLHHLGYPIAHVEADGSFILSNTPDSPGIVTTSTVKEQLLYEVHDPENYITPDVITDFTTLSLEQVTENQVRVSGVTGKPRPETLKLNIGRMEGYTRELVFTVGYPEARKKAEQLRTMINSAWDGLPIERVAFDYLGVNSLYGDIATLPDDPLELVIRVVYTAKDEQTLKTATRALMTNGLSGPAGMSISGATISARPRIVLGLWATLIHRDQLKPSVDFLVVS